MMRRVTFLLVAASTLMAPVSAWVYRTELVSKKGRVSFTGLKAMEDADDESIEAYRHRLESRFNAFGDHAHDFFSSASPLMNEDEAWLEEESTMACGDDCEVS